MFMTERMTAPTYEQAVAAATANPLTIPTYDEYAAFARKVGTSAYTPHQWDKMSQTHKILLGQAIRQHG